MAKAISVYHKWPPVLSHENAADHCDCIKLQLAATVT